MPTLGLANIECGVIAKYFFKTAVSDRESIPLVFRCPYSDSRLPTTAIFEKLRMPVVRGQNRPESGQFATGEKSVYNKKVRLEASFL